jgi:competence ComEA-like helix-hairpin-helix protein
MKFSEVSGKIGFTKTEFNVLLILILVFLFGLSLKIFRQNKYSYSSGNYSYKDSAFFSSAGRKINDEYISSKSEVNSNYKHYILELNKPSKRHIEKKPVEKTIDLNSAGIDEFIRLPGIGEKTAAKILELRGKKGRFNSIDELKEVKGIGNSKFEKIKNCLIIK